MHALRLLTSTSAARPSRSANSVGASPTIYARNLACAARMSSSISSKRGRRTGPSTTAKYPMPPL